MPVVRVSRRPGRPVRAPQRLSLPARPRRPRRPSLPTLARAAALAAALAIAGCGGGSDDRTTQTAPPDPQPAPAQTAAPQPSDADQIAALLAERGRALGDRDAAALTRTATTSQAARDRIAVRSAGELRLREVSYAAGPPQVDGERASVQAHMRYGIAGAPGAFGQARRLTLRRTGAGWRVGADRPAGRERLPWEVAPLAVERTEHFVIAHPATIGLGGVPDQLERGYRTMRELLPVKLADRYLVVVGTDPAQTERLTSGIAGLQTLAAVADSDVREDGPERRVSAIVSQRLVLVWSNFAGLDPTAQGRLVTHELTHLALAERTSGRTPSWLVEGAALYVSGDRRIFEPGAPSLAELSGPRGIARLAGARQSGAYARASATAFQIAQRYGRTRFFRLYESFNDRDLTASSAAELADAAVRRTLGSSLAALDRQTAGAQAGP